MDLFESIWNNRWLRTVSIILFLNKMDVLRKKVEQGKRIENYFPEFSSYRPPAESNGEWARVAIPRRHSHVILFSSLSPPEKRDAGESDLVVKARFFFRDQFLVSGNLVFLLLKLNTMDYNIIIIVHGFRPETDFSKIEYIPTERHLNSGRMVQV